MINMHNVLAIGAHFDDVDLGCGGTLARIVSEGGKAYKLTLTDNVTDFRQMGISIDFNRSLKDSANACKILGIEEIDGFQFQKCNYLQYRTELMQAIEKIIFEKPGGAFPCVW